MQRTGNKREELSLTHYLASSRFEVIPQPFAFWENAYISFAGLVMAALLLRWTLYQQSGEDASMTILAWGMAASIFVPFTIFAETLGGI
jgi:hypothetical protein